MFGPGYSGTPSASFRRNPVASGVISAPHGLLYPIGSTRGTAWYVDMIDQEIAAWFVDAEPPARGGRWMNFWNADEVSTALVRFAWNDPHHPHTWSAKLFASPTETNLIAGPLGFSPDDWLRGGRPECAAIGVIDPAQTQFKCCLTELFSQSHGNAPFWSGSLGRPRGAMRSMRAPIIVQSGGLLRVLAIIQGQNGGFDTGLDPSPQGFDRYWTLMGRERVPNGQWSSWLSYGSPPQAFLRGADGVTTPYGYQPGFDLTARVIWRDKTGNSRFNLFGATDTGSGIVEFADLGDGRPVWGALHVPPQTGGKACELAPGKIRASSAAHMTLPDAPSGQFRVSVVVECDVGPDGPAFWELYYDTRQGSVWRWQLIY